MDNVYHRKDSSSSIKEAKQLYFVEDNYILTERKHRKEKKWDIANTTTIIDWINTSNLYILLLDTYLKHLKRILRVNTLWSLLISSITSTISITQFTINETQQPELAFIIKLVIFVTSIFTSLITGYIKVEKIQETIEIASSHRENWMKFMTTFTNELQVSSKLRSNAETIITKNRQLFNELSFKRIEMPKTIQENVSLFITSRAKTDLQKKYSSKIVCCRRWKEHNSKLREFVELTQQQLSTYIMTRNLLKDELLLLSKVYNNVIRDITFKVNTDLLNYKINTRSVQLVENNKNGIINYSPVSSDDELSDSEDSIDKQEKHDQSNIRKVDVDNPHVKIEVSDDILSNKLTKHNQIIDIETEITET